MKISIIMPVFNVEAFLPETIKSILNQSYQDFELLIIDDGSIDGTLDVAYEFASSDQRISIHLNRNRKGVSGARNYGISVAKGNWICFLDGDDLLHFDALHERVEAIALFPEVKFLGGDFIRFDGNPNPNLPSQVSRNGGWARRFEISKMTGKPLILNRPIDHFLDCVLTWTGSVMIDAELIRMLDGFDEQLGMGEDDHLWIRVAASVDYFLFVPRSISFYRVRSGSLTNSKNAPSHNAPVVYQKLMRDVEFSECLDILRRKRLSGMINNAYYYRRSRQPLRAIGWSVRAVVANPLELESWRCMAGAILLRS